mgnify:FL=1
MDFKYDVIVIGAGHAGCEAAAASQSGLKDLPDYNGHEQNRADEL